MRFTIQVCFQIYSSYENKRALGGKSPRVRPLGYVLTIGVKFYFCDSIVVFSMEFFVDLFGLATET